MGQFAQFRTFPDASKRDLAGSNVDTLLYSVFKRVAGPFMGSLCFAPSRRKRSFLPDAYSRWLDRSDWEPRHANHWRKSRRLRHNRSKVDGNTPRRSQTNQVRHVVGRTYCSGTAQDYDAVHAMQDQYTLVPLALFGKPHPTPQKGVVDPNIDMTTPPRDQIDKLDAVTFFKRLALLMKSNPSPPQDAPMVATLTRLEVVGDFDVSRLPTSVSQGLSRVPETAHKKIMEQYASQKQANGWMVSTGSGHYGTDYLQRALIAYIGVGGNLPADAFYPIARFDGDGKVLNGASRYIMHFTKAEIPPIHPQGFWSLTMYDKEYFLVVIDLCISNRHCRAHSIS